MAPRALSRAVFLALLLGLPACSQVEKPLEKVKGVIGGLIGGKKEPPPVDLAAMRARRDSLRQAAARDSVTRARYAACADSVKAASQKAAKGKKKAAAQPALPEGMIPPEVLQACGRPPAPLAALARGDTGAKASVPGARKDSTARGTARDSTPVRGAKPDSAVTAKAPAAKPDSGKPALTAKQQQVLQADSSRQARERAGQDSLRRVTERGRQDSLARGTRDSTVADSLKGARETEVVRETFTYAGGARDPFASLIGEDQLGPDVNDLVLVGVYLDLRRAGNSVVVLRDKVSRKRYKLHSGDRLGRLKLSQIRQTEVVFTIEDVGFERQETLSLRKREDETP